MANIFPTFTTEFAGNNDAAKNIWGISEGSNLQRLQSV